MYLIIWCEDNAPQSLALTFNNLWDTLPVALNPYLFDISQLELFERMAVATEYLVVRML